MMNAWRRVKEQVKDVLEFQVERTSFSIQVLVICYMKEQSYLVLNRK